MSYKIGALVHSRTDEEIFTDLFFDEIRSGNILMERFTRGNVLERGRSLIAQGAQALIVRGGILFELTDNITEVPVIQIPLSANDVICALSESVAKYRKIHIVLPHSIIFDFDYCKKIFPDNIDLFLFYDIGQATQYIEKLSYSQDEAVLGGSIGVSIARQRGLNFIYANVRPAAVLEAYKTTISLLDQIYDDYKKVKLIESVLNNIEDGVIVISENGSISHFNHSCELILGQRTSAVLEKEFAVCFPELDELLGFKNNAGYAHHNSNSTLYKMGEKNLSIHTSRIKMSSDESQILITVKDVSKLQELEKTLRFKLNKKRLTARYTFEDILTISPKMQRLIQNAKAYALSSQTILIQGQSGTGKELFAQSIHNYSHRKNGPFVAVNCATLTESLLESELFGYVRGAFTGARSEGRVGLFELAHGGTLFLDEINSMSPNLQSKVLRAIEEKEIMRVGSDYVIPLDVRIIAATNVNLSELVRQNAFRKDLFFRLNVLDLQIPTLSERQEDILFLFRHFIREILGADAPALATSPEFERRLLTHPWMGNVRELKNIANKYVLFHEDNSHNEILGPSDEGKPASEPDCPAKDLKIDIKAVNRFVEEAVIQSLLEQGMTKTAVANSLGISRTALFKKMKKAGEKA